MDRAGIFVDASYVYAAGGELCCGFRSRGRFSLDVAGLVAMLEQLVATDANLPVLRTYWYDGARERIPTAGHLDIAALAHVRLRLGHVNTRNEQKGVDALIYRDIMTLARERALSDANLLSGDEDLREGVTAAQDMGVRVTLLGIPPKNQAYNQSRDLVAEADNVISLDADRISPFFSVISSEAIPAPLWEVGADDVAPNAPTINSVGRAYAKDWWERATSSERRTLVSSRPRVPATLDADLLTRARKELLSLDESATRTLRKAFWSEIPRSMAKEPSEEPTPADLTPP